MPTVNESLHPSKSKVDISDESSDDSDFAGSPSSPSSGSEVESKRLKRKARYEDVDSGDEKVIEEGGRKRKKRSSKDAAEVEEEGVGIRLRKRKDGRIGDHEKKPVSNAEGATVDVDQIWAQMNSTEQSAIAQPPATIETSLKRLSEEAGDSHTSVRPVDDTNRRTDTGHAATTASAAAEEMITIKRTYAFAGEMVTEEKTVLKSSAEARLYLQSQQTGYEHSSKPGVKTAPVRRPKKRASMFEPSSAGLGQASSTPSDKGKGPKLNTIEKSKLDWAGYVDQEGMKDELDGAEKSKDGYLGKREFLDRVVAKRDDEILGAKKR